MNLHQYHRSDRGRRRLVRTLLIVVNSILVVVFGAFLVWDYHVSWRTLLGEKKNALDEEAKVLLLSIARLKEQGLPAVQEHIDEVCGAMRETTSPGHHIAVRVDDQELQAHAHHRASPAMLAGMQQAANSVEGLATVKEDSIIVGSAASDTTSVYVSEYLSNIEKALRSLILRRFTSILLAGTVLALAVNLTLHRLLSQPLGRMVRVVHRLGEGDLGARMPETTTEELGLLADEFDRMAGAMQEIEEERRAAMKKAFIPQGPINGSTVQSKEADVSSDNVQEVAVSVDLDSGEVTMTTGETTVRVTLSQRLENICYVGNGVINAVTDFSPVETSAH